MTVPASIRTTPPIADAGAPPTADAWATAFAQALPYDAFLAHHATPDQRARWEGVRGRTTLTAAQNSRSTPSSDGCPCSCSRAPGAATA